jgi:hypothetical protein
MPERDPHPDTDVIDQTQEDSVPAAQAGRSGGNVSRTVGTRAELNEAQGTLEGDDVERATGSDNPADDEMKGNKTFDKIRTGDQAR